VRGRLIGALFWHEDRIVRDGAADPVGIVGGPTGRKTTDERRGIRSGTPPQDRFVAGCREFDADDVIVEDFGAVKSVLIFGLLA
jgi:hypothetical protein